MPGAQDRNEPGGAPSVPRSIAAAGAVELGVPAASAAPAASPASPGPVAPAGTADGATPGSVTNAAPAGWATVPWRTIVATIGLVVATALGALALYLTSHVLVLITVSGFFAVVLARPVGWLQRRARLRRGLAIAVVVSASLLLIAGLLALFVVPLRAQLVNVATDLPGTIEQAGRGEGPWGRVVTGLHLESIVQRNQERLNRSISQWGDSVPTMITRAVDAAVAVVTVVVMTCLLLSQSANIAQLATRLVPRRHREWATVAGRDAARAISGYMIGNLIISLCAGVTAFVLLVLLGVPNPVVIALWVAFADLIPLVGATLGAVVAVLAALIVSPAAGIIAVVFFVLYQQFENGVLQVVVMARTVRVNPLVVLLSVLVGVELFGILGALLAVPVAGAGLVIAKEVWAHRPGVARELVVVRSPVRRRRRADRAASPRGAAPGP